MNFPLSNCSIFLFNMVHLFFLLSIMRFYISLKNKYSLRVFNSIKYFVFSLRNLSASIHDSVDDISVKMNTRSARAHFSSDMSHYTLLWEQAQESIKLSCAWHFPLCVIMKLLYYIKNDTSEFS